MPWWPVLAAVFAVTLGAGGAALGQDTAGRPAQAAAPDGREAEPGVPPTLVSTPLPSAVTIDGVLEEPAWSAAPLATGFTQREPLSGSPATEPTEFRVLTDERGLYLGIRLHDADPGGLLRKLRGRDAGALPARQFWNEDDSVAILLDTFHDHRNAYYFAVNPNAARTDALITDEGLVINFDWDGVWEAATSVDEGGWTAEIFVPWTTLRFGGGESHDIGLNVQRMIRRKTEETFWAPVSLDENLWWISKAGHLDDLQVPSASLPLEFKPYVSSTWSGGPASVNEEFDTQPGFDAKIGVAHGLTLDLTVKTDFAQVEVDAQRVNLTRFPLFFPEKREFFLENAGLFDVGIPRIVNLFFSRRIGLDAAGQLIPILAGGRLTGRVGGFEVGILDVQTEETDSVPTANHAVVRVRRQLMERSTVGFLVTNINSADGSLDNRLVAGDVDLNWGQVSVNAFVAKSSTPGLEGDDLGFGGTLLYSTDTAALRLLFDDFDENFHPAMGFLPRGSIHHYQPSGRIGFRPGNETVRRVFFRALSDFTYDLDWTLVTRNTWAHGVIVLDSDDQMTVQVNNRFELLDRPFEIHPGTTLPPGTYTFTSRFVRVNLSERRPVSGSLRYERGDFFSGDRRAVDLRGALRLSSHLALLPSYQRNTVNLPEGNFVTNLGGLRINLTPTNNFIVNAFFQYNDTTDRVSTNLRVNYIYRPGSDLFVVYNETRDLLGSGIPIQDRQLVVKLTYLWRR